MTLVAELAGSDEAHRVGIGDLGLTTRADGQPGRGGIIFDDPDSSILVRGWMKVVVSETACVSQPVLFSGYIQERRYSRNASGNYRHGAARFIDTDLIDENGVFHVRLITGQDGKRDAETHIERNDWLMASAYMSGLVENEDLVDTSNPRPFEEADYRGQYSDDVLNDITGPISRRFFMYLEGDGDRSEFLDVPDATVATSTLSISNVIDDVEADANCYYPFVDAVLTRDPTEVYDKARFTYKNGTVIETNLATKAEFFDDNGLLYRGIQIDNSRVGVESTARSMAQNILARASKELDTITCQIEVPRAKAGLIRAGQRIHVRFTHLDGYTSFAYTRITGITYKFGDTNKTYKIELELNARGRSLVGGGGAPGPGGFPHPTAGSPSLVQSAVRQDGGVLTPPIVNPTDGDLMYLWLVERGVGTYPGTPSGWTSVATARETSVPFGGFFHARLVTKTASGDTAASLAVDVNISGVGATFMEWGGSTFGAEVHLSDQGTTTGSTLTCGGAITPGAANAIVVGCGIVGMFNVSDVSVGAPEIEIAHFGFPGGNAPTNWVGYKAVATPASTTIGGAITGRSEYGGVTFTLLPSAASDPPIPGQWVYSEIPSPAPDGSTVTFTTAFPYASGSLNVYVDNLDQTAAIVSQDGATGTFTLSFAPWGTDVLTVTYQGI